MPPGPPAFPPPTTLGPTVRLTKDPTARPTGIPGRPAARPPFWNAPKLITAAVAVVMALTVAGIVGAGLSGGTDNAGSTSRGSIGGVDTSRSTRSATTQSSAAPVPVPRTTAAPTTPPPPDVQLAVQVAADMAAAERLVGSWVPQLSSKAIGLVADGIVYDYPSILADFRTRQQQYSSVLLIYSADYVSFQNPTFWVTVYNQPFSTPEGANGWCDARGIDRDNCFAKRLRHDGGPEGNTVLRP